jgi:hypothetical protein
MAPVLQLHMCTISAFVQKALRKAIKQQFARNYLAV